MKIKKFVYKNYINFFKPSYLTFPWPVLLSHIFLLYLSMDCFCPIRMQTACEQSLANLFCISSTYSGA